MTREETNKLKEAAASFCDGELHTYYKQVCDYFKEVCAHECLEGDWEKVLMMRGVKSALDHIEGIFELTKQGITYDVSDVKERKPKWTKEMKKAWMKK